MKPIGIIGAMESEVSLLRQQMSQPNAITVGRNTYYAGQLAGKPAVVVQSGIGKVSAAMCAQALIDRFEVFAIVNTGVAGGLHPSLRIGDLVIAEDAVQHDFDLTALGHAKGYLPCCDKNSKQPSRFSASKELSAALCRAAEQVLTPIGRKYIRGTIASGDIFVDDSQLKRELITQFGAAAVEMEGAAIAQVAFINQVPFAILRAISDLAEQEANVNFESFEKEAAALSAKILLQMLQDD